MKVLITGKLPAAAEERLRQSGYEIDRHDEDAPLTPEALRERAKDADGMITLLADKIDEALLEAAPRLKVVANYAVGYNNIDVKAATARGVTITNTPDVLTAATADLAAALALACARRVLEGDALMRAGKFTGWKPDMLLGAELEDKTVGVVGAGRIGSAFARRMAGFGMRVAYFNRSRNERLERELGAERLELAELMRRADLVSLHVPLSEETRGLVSAEMIAALKPTAIVVNTARGEVIDEKALIDALKNRRIFAAGFDVYENEPNLNPDLFELTNVVLLPHLGSATKETRDVMADLAARNVAAVLNGETPPTPVEE
ncbi:MAG: D-glycerate dehydrogenase [Ignavibacteriales bacterium]|nr:D-glycerate dehydrogenase [Ignavibacteriales bacterium]